eukprot:TRINITY_DN33777_c0_g2_i1.p1 TRINITY_DN33777_c0_g2~~TRINITY_DN33777_c0_g2_i1.p1  ORF type:complete len:341 (-),score=96.27 TRINITY_DN33777_c0_g2_i1:216-1238(-)
MCIRDRLSISALALFLVFVVGFGRETIRAIFLSAWPIGTVFTEHSSSLKSKRVLITGANSGIGNDLASVMVRQGAHLHVACRSGLHETTKQLRDLAESCGSGSRIEGHSVDLSEGRSVMAMFQSLRAGVDRDGGFDLVCLNAGVAMNLTTQQDDINLVTFVNYFANFVICKQLIELNLLAPKTPTSAPRIVFTNSYSHHQVRYTPLKKRLEDELGMGLYMYSKLCLQMLANHLRSSAEHVEIASVCPGGVYTPLFSKSPSLSRYVVVLVAAVCFQSCGRAAKHVAAVCCDPGVPAAGTYKMMMHEERVAADAMDPKNVQDLIQTSEEWYQELQSQLKAPQ